MPSSPRTLPKTRRSRRLYKRNSVRKQLSYSGKKKKRSPPKASFRVSSRKGQNLLAKLEKLMQE